jgi:K+-transporting ATPase A subunit
LHPFRCIADLRVVIVGALAFLPALTLGAGAEHFAMQAGLLF